jgi:aspartate carbamoyltransferase regulatory subunit
MFRCSYCNKEYSTKGILETHQKSAKFCIRLRNANEHVETTKQNVIINLKCEYCDDNFSLKHVLERHY